MGEEKQKVAKDKDFLGFTIDQNLALKQMYSNTFVPLSRTECNVFRKIDTL